MAIELKNATSSCSLKKTGINFYDGTFNTNLNPPTATSNTQFVLPDTNGTTDKILRWTPSGTTEWVALSSIVIGNNFVNAGLNAGNAGVGPFDNITSNTMEFRNLNIVGTELSLALDVPNKNIDLQANVGTTSGTLAAGNDPRFDAKNVLVVKQAPIAGSSEFTSILSAITYINALPGPQQPTDTNRFIIYVQAGTYTETATLNVPQYVFIVGQSMEACRVVPSATGYDLFVLINATGLAFLTINDVASPNIGITFDDVGDYALIHKVEMNNCPRSIYCTVSTQDSYVYIEYTGLTDSTEYSIFTQGDGIHELQVSCENYFVFNHSDDAFITDGALTELLVQACVLQVGDGLGNGFTFQNDAHSEIRDTYIQGYGKGINVVNDASTPEVQLSSVLFDGCTINMDIANTNTIGFFSGYSEYNKIILDVNTPFFITNTDRNVITVAKKGGDFNTVAGALTAVVGATSTNPFTIVIGPGTYTEAPFTIPSYVNVNGYARTSTTLILSTPGSTFITMEEYGIMSNLTIEGTNVAGSIGVFYDGGTTTGSTSRLTNITFNSFETLVLVNTNVGSANLIMDSCGISYLCDFTYGVYIEDTNPIAGKSIKALVNQLVWNAGDNSMNTLFYAESHSTLANPNISFYLTNIFVGNTIFAPFGKCVECNGRVLATITNCSFTGYATCISFPNTVSYGQTIRLGSTFINNCTNDIVATNTNTVGFINVNATKTKITVASNNISIIINDLNGDTVLSGALFQGDNYSQSTNISVQLQQGSNIGKIDNAIITVVAGLQVNLAAGEGYLMIGTYTYASPNYMQYVSWISQNITLPASSLSYIYIDAAGTVQSSLTEPNYLTSIICGTVKTNATDVEFIQGVTKHADHTATELDETLRNGVGPIFGSGCLAGPGSSGMLVSVTSGTYYFSVDVFNPVSGTDISMLAYYSGSSDATTITNVPTDWDNAGTITALTAGQYTKHSLYVVGDNTNEPQAYIFIYGQQTFASQLLAENGPIPTPPSFIGLNCVPIASIIVTFGDTTLTSNRFQDIRPTLSFRSNGTTTSSDHNSLSNLTVGNAHPQYFRVDGTSSMAGSMNLATNNIINIGTANGVTIEAHASRHLPGGADPLTTAAPTANLSPSSTNSTGSANSFSRSDHTHAINTALVADIQDVAATNGAGSSNNYARGDHSHRGVHSIKVPLGSNEYGDITLTAGTSMTITDIAGNFTFDATTVINQLSPSIATGFDVDYTSGDVIIDGQYYVIASGTITLPANTTGVIYVDPITQLVSSTIGSVYPTDSVPIASYTTNGVIVTVLTDNRTYLNNSIVYPINANKGGTGFDTYAVGDLLYADTTTTLAKLADVAIGNVLLSGGIGAAPLYGKVNLSTMVTNVLPIANGGTNSSTALSGDRVMLSTATAIVESGALSDGSLIIGRTGNSPIVATISGTTNQVIVTNGAGSITLSLPQAIALISSPSFASLFLTNTTNQLVLGTTNTVTINSVAPVASRSYTIPDTGANSSFVMTDGNQTINGTKTFSTPIIPTSGGIGAITPFTIGDLLYADTTTTLAKLSDIATGNVLLSGGVGVAPSYGKVNLSTAVSNILSIANGGTNSSIALSGNRVMLSSATAIVESGAMNDGFLIIGSSSGAPLPGTLTAGSGVSIVNSTNSITISATGSGGTVTSVSVSGGASGLTYSGNPVTGSGTITLSSGILVPSYGGTGANLTPNPGAIIYSATGATLNQTAVGTSGQVLQSNATGTPTWTTDISGNSANVTGIVAANHGGTGFASYTVGDILYANTTTTLAKLADIATGNALITGGVGVAPSYGKIGLTTHVTGLLPIANGGTNSATALTNGKLMWSAAGAIVEATALSNGQIFIGSTGSSPVAATLTAGSGISITNGAGSVTISSTGSTITATANTTNSVNTNLDTIATTTNSAGCTEWFVTAYDTVSNNVLSRRIYTTYRNVAGVVTILASSTTTNSNTIGGGSNTTIIASGTNVALRINGHSANLCRWKSQRSIYFDA